MQTVPEAAITSEDVSSLPGKQTKRQRMSSGGHRISVVKRAGKVAALSTACSSDNSSGTLGIAHTRWATHGPPNDVNAHPHTSEDGTLAVVHNGIVENFSSLREELQRKGYVMRSDTDTELIAHLIYDIRKQKWMALEEAVRQALSQVEGAFGLAVVATDEPDLLIGARNGSPLIVGIGEDEYILASDASAVVERTKQVYYLKDGEMVIMRRNEGYQVKTLENVQLVPEVQQLSLSVQEIQKGSYKHFMLKGVCSSQPLLNTFSRTVQAADSWQAAFTSNLVHVSGVRRDHGTARGPRELHAWPCPGRGGRHQHGRPHPPHGAVCSSPSHHHRCVRYVLACWPPWRVSARNTR